MPSSPHAVALPSRRSVAKGAAWAVPAVAAGAAVPAAAASACILDFEVEEPSNLCCADPTEEESRTTARLLIRISDPDGCVRSGSRVCLLGLESPSLTIDEVTFPVNSCVGDLFEEGGATIEAVLFGISSCAPEQLTVVYTLDGVPGEADLNLASLRYDDDEFRCT